MKRYVRVMGMVLGLLLVTSWVGAQSTPNGPLTPPVGIPAGPGVAPGASDRLWALVTRQVHLEGSNALRGLGDPELAAILKKQWELLGMDGSAVELPAHFGLPGPGLPPGLPSVSIAAEPVGFDITVTLDRAARLLPEYGATDDAPDPAAVKKEAAAQEEILKKAIERANTKVKEIYDQRRGEAENLLKEKQESEQLAQRRYDTARVKLGAAENLAAKLDLSPQNVPAEIKSLEEQKRSWSLELTGKQARQKAIAEVVADLRARAQANLQDDPMTKELEKIVGLREKQLSLLQGQLKLGLVGATDVGAAEIALSEAKIQLLQRREALARALGADSLGKLNAELLTLSIDTAEMAARLKAVSERLEPLRQLAPQVDSYERIKSNELPRAEMQLEKARAESEAQEKQFSRLKQPTITLVAPEQP
jgi:hypothetical protein